MKESKLKDISKLYNIIDVIGEDIITSKGKVNIYEVTPCMIIDDSDEIKNNIFNSYLLALKMINFDYQIIVNTSKMNFNNILNVLNKNIYNTDNAMQKKFIIEYKRHLFNLSKEVQIFCKSFYFVINKLKTTDENQLKEAFNNMKHLGISIQKVTTEEKIYKILYESINRISEGDDINEYN